jgi:hypothetical protein
LVPVVLRSASALSLAEVESPLTPDLAWFVENVDKKSSEHGDLIGLRQSRQ